MTKAGLAELRKRAAKFTSVPETTAEYQDLTKCIAEVRTTRTSIEARRKELKAPFLEWARELDSMANDLKDQLADIEAPLKELKAQRDEQKRLEKEAAEKAERERLAELNKRLEAIRNEPLHARGEEPAEIADRITAMTELVIDQDTFQDQVELAEVARQEALMLLRAAYQAAVEREDAERVRQEELEELRRQEEQQREELARLKAENERLERERQEREEQEAQERAKREAQEAAERDAERQRKADAERKAKEKEAERQRATWQRGARVNLPRVQEYLDALVKVERPKLTKTAPSQLVAAFEVIDAAISEANSCLDHVAAELGED